MKFYFQEDLLSQFSCQGSFFQFYVDVDVFRKGHSEERGEESVRRVRSFKYKVY